MDGGWFLMGSEADDAVPGDGEGPVRRVRVSAFRIAPKAVTNTQFATFVKDSGYETDAERFGSSYVFAALLAPALLARTSGYVRGAPWWRMVPGASWRRPEGPDTTIAQRQNHPVVHISYNDAVAYCTWAGARLPSEAEWEFAARGGLEQNRYPWGEEREPRGEHRCNIWQGTFPHHNTADDGYVSTAPVSAYRPNGYGLFGVVGNVWEWCHDWFSTTHHRDAPREDPQGPPDGEAKVLRGGSYLCHDSYCNRYRVSARTSNTPETSTGHQGLRIAADID